MLNARGGFESDLTIVRLGTRRVLHHHRLRADDARFRVDRARDPRRRARCARRCDQRVFGDLGDGAEGRGAAQPRLARRPLEDRHAVLHDEDDRRRLRARSRRANELRRRSRLRALRVDRPVRDALRSALERRRRARASRRGLLHDRRAAHRSRSPRVGRRAVARRNAVGSGPRLRGEDGQADAASSAATRSRSSRPRASGSASSCSRSTIPPRFRGAASRS